MLLFGADRPGGLCPKSVADLGEGDRLLVSPPGDFLPEGPARLDREVVVGSSGAELTRGGPWEAFAQLATARSAIEHLKPLRVSRPEVPLSYPSFGLGQHGRHRQE